MAARAFVTGGDLEACLHVARFVSSPDAAEIRAAAALSSEEALRLCFLRSFRCWKVLFCGEPVFVFGLSREDWRWVTPWAFSTPAASRIGIGFARGSRQVARRLFSAYPFMRNWVDARHVRSIAWLRFMGFELGGPEPYGAAGLPFLPFWHVG